jgi:hypothetical protein
MSALFNLLILNELENECENETEECESFSERESEERDWLENATSFWLTSYAVDVRSEDHSRCNCWTNC